MQAIGWAWSQSVLSLKTDKARTTTTAAVASWSQTNSQSNFWAWCCRDFGCYDGCELHHFRQQFRAFGWGRGKMSVPGTGKRSSSPQPTWAQTFNNSRTWLYSEYHLSTVSKEEHLPARGEEELMTPTKVYPLKRRSKSAPSALWAIKKYSQQLWRMNNEFDSLIDKGEMRKVMSAGLTNPIPPHQKLVGLPL